MQCNNSTPLVQVEKPPTKIRWSPKMETRLESMATARTAALSALSGMYETSAKTAARSQQYWETLVFETGHLAALKPKNTHRVQQLIADWLPIKLGRIAEIREPLLNAQRISAGLMREVGIYSMVGKTGALNDMLRKLAKERNITLQTDDLRRILEEGLTPQRKAVFGNSDLVDDVLTDRFNTFQREYLDRGFTDEDISALLTEAQHVSAQWDELRAVQIGMGLTPSEMFNIGYFPRTLTDDVLPRVRTADFNTADLDAVVTKSRSTWQYLPEDHKMLSNLLHMTPEALLEVLPDTKKFAALLAEKLSGRQIELLVDSGILSKVPVLTTDVAEMITKHLPLPVGITPEIFIADPLRATEVMVTRMKTQLQNAAVLKLVTTEGAQRGWAVPPELVKQSPELFGDFVKLSTIAGDSNLLVHPDVAATLQGLIKLASDPSELSNAAHAWQWFTHSFRMQALGNPITGGAYLGRQWLGNLISVVGNGSSAIHFFTSLADMLRLVQGGLDVFDNVKPYRIIDGVPVTHREVLARTLRNFSHDVLPGYNPERAGSFIDWEALNPMYMYKQFTTMYTDETYKDVALKILRRGHDAVFSPVLQLAQLIDLAGQLAVIKGKSLVGENVALERVAQAATSLAAGKKATWAELVGEVKRTFPMLDDVGKLTRVVSYVVPFKFWAMANLPVQVRDMLKNPSRWANFSRLYGIWNENAYGDDEPLQGEFKQHELDMYGLVLFRDSENKRTHLMSTQNFDPKWGALTWFREMLPRDRTAKELRNDIEGKSTQKFFADLASSSYFAGAFKLMSGIDPLTGLRRDDSPLAFQQFANIPMPPWMAAVLSISPVLQAVDRLPFISGTRQLEDARTGQIIEPAVQGWLGNPGTLTPHKLQGLESLAQTLGARVRVIDGLRNMQYEEQDIRRVMGELQSKYRQEQIRLARDLSTGAEKRDTTSYMKRNEALNKMVDTTFQLNMDLARVEAWAALNGVPSREALKELQLRQIDTEDLPLPGSGYMQQAIQDAMQLKR